jgi:UDP-glucose:(heptosyl)LPS alpha-1,3-glucosyltransferase
MSGSSDHAEQQTAFRVALVHPHFRPDGGAERAAVQTLNALEAKAVQVTVVSRSWHGTDTSVERLQCDPFYIGRLWREWSFARAARKIVYSHHFDLVQSQVRFPGCHIYRAGGGVHAEWLTQRNRVSGTIRKLLTYLSPFHAYKRHTERVLYSDANLQAIICNSRMVKDEIRSWFEVPNDKIRVIYNAVDTEKYSPESLNRFREETRTRLGIEPNQTVFLFVGSGFERKGLPALMKSVQKLPADCHLLIVGQDKRHKRYGALAKRFGIAEKLHFLGLQEDVRPYYAAADAFVLPTLYDAFANTVLEAMASGLPVITSTKCGAVDMIESGRNGFICDALDVDALSDCMLKLISEQTRRSLGTAARATVTDLTLERMSHELFHLYDSILDGRGRDQ